MTNAQELRLEAQEKAKSDALNRALKAATNAEEECCRLKGVVNMLAVTILILMISGGYYMCQEVRKVDYRDYTHEQWARDRLKN